ncbi:hypothetical protein [Spirosoma luteum]|uniref:hypothetical protein n=1 Tax=Spirosoma luteum TaxID=431553 RepID=UPI0012F7B17C|nr:hypothetical protein [Spirosoma luteum]
MQTATMSLDRPYTDLMPKDIFIFLLYGTYFTMPPGSAFLNFVIASYWLWHFPVSHTARLLPGLYKNVEKEPYFKIIIDFYKVLKSIKKQGLATLEEKKELKQIEQTIEEISPTPRLLLAKYYPNVLLGAVVLAFVNYRLHRIFPETMKLLFGESIWQHFQ